MATITNLILHAAVSIFKAARDNRTSKAIQEETLLELRCKPNIAPISQTLSRRPWSQKNRWTLRAQQLKKTIHLESRLGRSRRHCLGACRLVGDINSIPARAQHQRYERLQEAQSPLITHSVFLENLNAQINTVQRTYCCTSSPKRKDSRFPDAMHRPDLVMVAMSGGKYRILVVVRGKDYSYHLLLAQVWNPDTQELKLNVVI